MRAMVLEQVKEPLLLKEVPIPNPEEHEVLIQVKACGVCRTDLHIFQGEIPPHKLPLILGHQVVGIVEKPGFLASKFKVGDRVGVPWLGGCCKTCEFCQTERENLCDQAIYTGHFRDGGYAEYVTAHEDFLFSLPDRYDDVTAAPLLCAGFIGYRSFRLAGFAKTLGLYGFGSSAHLLIQLACFLGCSVCVFTRPGDRKTQEFAKSLGAVWAGGSDELPPYSLDACILFASVGGLYSQALKAVKKGGKVVSACICMSDIPSFPYHLLWGERAILSTSNLTRQDGMDFLQVASQFPLKVFCSSFALEEANQALQSVQAGSSNGSIVLKI